MDKIILPSKLTLYIQGRREAEALWIEPVSDNIIRITLYNNETKTTLLCTVDELNRALKAAYQEKLREMERLIMHKLKQKRQRG